MTHAWLASGAVCKVGMGILPMLHGLEGDPQRGILRWGPQAHATGPVGWPFTSRHITLKLCVTK